MRAIHDTIAYEPRTKAVGGRSRKMLGVLQVMRCPNKVGFPDYAVLDFLVTGLDSLNDWHGESHLLLCFLGVSELFAQEPAGHDAARDRATD